MSWIYPATHGDLLQSDPRNTPGLPLLGLLRLVALTPKLGRQVIFRKRWIHPACNERGWSVKSGKTFILGLSHGEKLQYWNFLKLWLTCTQNLESNFWTIWRKLGNSSKTVLIEFSGKNYLTQVTSLLGRFAAWHWRSLSSGEPKKLAMENSVQAFFYSLEGAISLLKNY